MTSEETKIPRSIVVVMATSLGNQEEAKLRSLPREAMFIEPLFVVLSVLAISAFVVGAL